MRVHLEKKMEEIQERMNEMLPQHMHRGVRNYLWDGIPAGGFLSSVLENNLKDAACQADGINAPSLSLWGQFLCWYMPMDSIGSKEKVEAWCAMGGWNGMLKSKEAENEV